MPQPRKRKRRTPRQELGVRLALKIGIPQTCPLWQVVNGEEACKESDEYCGAPNLDEKSGIDYRLCEIFTQWFWREVKKEELEGLAPHKPAKQSPENKKEGEEENEHS